MGALNNLRNSPQRDGVNMFVELEDILDGMVVWIGDPDTDGSEVRDAASRHILSQLLQLEPPRCVNGNSVLYALTEDDTPTAICLGDLQDVIVDGDFFYALLPEGERCKLTLEPSHLLTVEMVKAELERNIREGRQILLCQDAQCRVLGVDRSELSSRTTTVVREARPSLTMGVMGWESTTLQP